MFVSLFLVAFFLSVSQSAAYQKVALKDQLAKSIAHVSEILVDVENKIGRERKILSQIDTDLTDMREAGRMPADYEINIFWNTSSTQPGGGGGVPGKFGNFTYIVKTTPSLFPTPLTQSTYATRPESWDFTTQAIIAESLYIADLKKNMVSKHYGYFSAFLDEFTELVMSKPLVNAYAVTSMLSMLISINARHGTFNELGEHLLGGLTILLTWFDALTPARVQQQAGVLHHLIQIKRQALSDDWNNLIDYYDNLTTHEEGHALFESLEYFFVYPEANVTLATVGHSIFQAASAPYVKSKGTRKQRRFVQLLTMAAHDLDPHFRTQTKAYFAKGYIPAPLTQRRRMNYKKIVKHFLLKHPKLFKKIERQYKHDKKNKNQHVSHKQKRHHNYRNNRDRRHGHRHEQDQISQRSHTDSNKKLENEQVENDSIESGAYYGENPKAHRERNIHNERKELIDKLKQRRQMQHIPKQRQRKLPEGTRTATSSFVEYSDVDQADPQYIKQLAIDFLKKRQQSQNFQRNRRFNIPSVEEDFCDHSQFVQDTIENDKLQKIREASSYSDEENHLRMNLYDTLRHGNRTFVSFRKSNGDNIINKLRDLSSGVDDEWVIKKNIYKVFEQEK